MGIKKDPVFRDRVRIASSIRSENGSILTEESGKKTKFAEDKFNEFSFLKESSVKTVIDKYLNNLDRGI